MMSRAYDFKAVEEKWRPIWRERGLYETGSDPEKGQHYILDFFPYPSGAGLSVGHCRNYVPTCISARYKRMNGYNVLHPMGWDSFGLPAENFAIKHGVHPRITTERHEATYRRQMELVECCYDWSREFSSTDPAYYRWTQWFFLLLFRRGLAYRAGGSQWWCPQCQTILANEQVEGGRCWRCGSQVTKKTLQQWYFKITAYADRLIADLEEVDWPEPIKAMQRNWIGRSEGAEIVFGVEKGEGEAIWEIDTFTTRPDTLFGVTFLALAPEHPLATELATPERREAVAAYVEEAQRHTEIDRQAAARPKTGVSTGRHAAHPMTGEPIPVWVADYVLTGYGSGAIMGVPGHDERDNAFARQYGLEVKEVIRPDGHAGDHAGEEECFTGQGIMINSGRYSGLRSEEGATQICTDLEARDAGRRAVTYKMRDWLISRQRYWGTPIPIVHCPACGPVPVPEDELPVLLPHVEAFAPAGDGRSPLARVDEWVETTCPACGGAGRRETDTMDGFACSSWYFLRFASPHEDHAPIDPEAVAHWLPVDVYVGGAEHAVMHLLYARFWTKVMYDAGLVDFVEPFSTLRNQGVLHAGDGQRMSKSRGNVITPDEVIAEHGTDALRTYVVFIGPFEANVVWDDAGIKGVTRFLDRFWSLANHIASGDDGQGKAATVADPAFARQMHRTIKRVTEDVEAFKFNTAVAALMEWLNGLYEADAQGAAEDGVSATVWREAIETFCLLLAPFAPFITEEVWQEVLGHETSVHRQSWPGYDEEQIQASEITVAVQVNGRLRDTITVPADFGDEELEEAALASANVQRHVDGRPISKTIVVPGRLVNFVV